jgi:hypothetical protein
MSAEVYMVDSHDRFRPVPQPFIGERAFFPCSRVPIFYIQATSDEASLGHLA